MPLCGRIRPTNNAPPSRTTDASGENLSTSTPPPITCAVAEPLVPVDAAAVVAEVQMAVEPAVGGDIRRDVPSSAAELADEHAPATGATPQGGRTAHDDVLLMAVDDLGRRRAPRTAGDGMDWCAGPGRTRDCQARCTSSDPTRLVAIAITERHQRRRYARGHVARQLERIALGSADDPVGPEERRNDVDDPHLGLSTSSLTDMNHAGNIQAQRCS